MSGQEVDVSNLFNDLVLFGAAAVSTSYYYVGRIIFLSNFQLF